MTRTSKNLSKFLYIRFIVAVSIVALLMISSFFIVNEIVYKHQDDSIAINISGRQRMLSQKIAFLTQSLLNSSSKEETLSIKQKIKESIDLFESSHENLVHGNTELGLQELESRKLKNHYFNYPIFLDREIKAFVHHAHEVTKLSENEIKTDNESILYIKNEASGDLIKNLDKAVILFEEASNEAISKFVIYENIFFLFGLLAILFQVFVIFRPMSRKIVKTNEELEKANNLKEHFLKNINHELRTPLNSIFGNAEMILSTDLTDYQEHQMFKLLNSADLLLNKIEDLVEISKLSQGEIKLQNINFDIKEMFNNIIELYSSKAASKNLELIVNYPDNLPQFFIGDPRRLRQVVTNLLENAVKYTDSGHVLLNVNLSPSSNEKSPDKYNLRVNIEDTGSGIDAEKQKNLFNNFQSVEDTEQNTFNGTGVGLAICQHLVERMHGDIGVESIKDAGSKFWFEIELNKSEKDAEKNVNWEILKNVRALIVDDVELNRELLREKLSNIGLKCDTADSGELALSKLNQACQDNKPFQILITDYLMPGMNGKNLTKIVKSNELLKDTVVVILTSAGGEAGHEKLFADAGASGFMGKPIKTKVLLDLLSVIWSKNLNLDNSLTTVNDINNYEPINLSDYSYVKDRNILLVEDNKFCQEITKKIISELGCNVTIAENGAEAVDMVKRDRYDLIFMDLQMPVMDGFEATKKIRMINSKIPIVALTAHIYDDDIKLIEEAGMSDHLAKPIRKENFTSWIINFFKVYKPSNENGEIDKTLIDKGYASNLF